MVRLGMEKTTLYLPEDLRVQLAQVAKHEKRSQADNVREALGQYLGAKPVGAFRSVGLGAADELTAASSKGWVRASWNRKRRGNP